MQSCSFVTPMYLRLLITIAMNFNSQKTIMEFIIFINWQNPDLALDKREH